MPRRVNLLVLVPDRHRSPVEFRLFTRYIASDTRHIYLYSPQPRANFRLYLARLIQRTPMLLDLKWKT
jgi:hypothetical protein